jgi:hypothetical protein
VERKNTPEERQRSIFLLYALFATVVVLGLQIACSADLRDSWRRCGVGWRKSSGAET